jgi:cation transport regulator
MPCAANADLPPSARNQPGHGQSEAFNHAHAAHAGEQRQEAAAQRLAWAAVKHSYVKVGNAWVPRAAASSR